MKRRVRGFVADEHRFAAKNCLRLFQSVHDQGAAGTHDVEDAIGRPMPVAISTLPQFFNLYLDIFSRK